MAFGFGNHEIVVPEKPAEISRYSMMICAMFCSICMGAIFAFSLISDKMSKEYHFDQNDITTISTVGIVVGYFTLPFGLIYDYYGPKPVFVLGVLLYVTGSLLFALTFLGTIGHSVAGLAVINAVMNLGCSLFDMSSVLTVLSWFPLNRGYVVACVKTATGLGSSVVATIYSTYFMDEHSTYMFFLMGLVIVIGSISFVVFYLPPYHMTGYRLKTYTEEDHEKATQFFRVYLKRSAPLRRFYPAFVLTVSLVILLLTQSIVFVFIEEPTFSQRNAPAVIMIVLYLSLVGALAPVKFLEDPPEKEETGSNTTPLTENAENTGSGNEMQVCSPEYTNQENEPTPLENTDALAAPNRDALSDSDALDEFQTAESTHEEDDKISPQYPTGFFTNIRHAPLWCMWINGFCVSGVVHVVMLNSRQIFVAVSEDPDDKTRPALYVAITSIGSAMGRLAFAFFEIKTQSAPLEKRIPLTTAYCIPSCLQAIACILFLFVPAKALLAPMLLSGIGNGVYAAALVLTVRTIFSLDVAKHYNSIFFAESLAVVALNRFVFGEIMTRNSENNEEGEPQCLGRDKCIRTTFIVLACVCVLGFAASVFLHILYSRFVASVLRDREERKRSKAKLENL